MWTLKHGLINSHDIRDSNNSEHHDYGLLGCDALLFLGAKDLPTLVSWWASQNIGKWNDVHINAWNMGLSTLLGLITAVLLEKLTVIQMFQRFPAFMIIISVTFAYWPLTKLHLICTWNINGFHFRYRSQDTNVWFKPLLFWGIMWYRMVGNYCFGTDRLTTPW